VNAATSGLGEGALDRLVGFVRALRAEGLPVGTGRMLTFRRAAELAPDDLYWAGRATLLTRREDEAPYRRVFQAWFGEVPTLPVRFERPSPRLQVLGVDPGGEGRVTEVEGPDLQASLASALEALRDKSFAVCTPEELAELARLMPRLRLAVPVRRGRRTRPARKGAPDLRRTLRRALRTGGEPVQRSWRVRRARRRRLVLILDVSGSMAAYSRALVMFAHAALRADSRFEAFCFGTRLTRLTRPLLAARPDEALRRAAAEAEDWDGGTRIGASLKAFLDGWGHAGMARGAVVVICSDGLDVGEPEVLSQQMAHLRRLAHRVVWLNPLKENPLYEPLARGMAAALPQVDVFASGHNLASLERVADVIERL
jgi:uncharacterized protein with von Willebrand factor type A (vWA) domain